MARGTLRAGAHSVYRLFYPIVLVTKFRRPALSRAMLQRVREQIARLCTGVGCTLLECHGEPDHVHLLVEASPCLAPRQLVNTLKTVPSRELRREFAGEFARYYGKPFLWSRSYCVVSCGGAPLTVLKRSIEQQNSFGSGYLHPAARGWRMRCSEEVQ